MSYNQSRVVPVKVRQVRYLAGFGSGQAFGTHADCLTNLTRGIVERVLYVRGPCGGLVRAPRPIDGVFQQRLSRLRASLLRNLRPTPVVPIEDYPSLYSGRKQVIYQRAVDTLLTRRVTARDAVVSTFVKAEKVNFSKKVDPAPRVIQPRSPRYNVMVGRYLKLFEKELCAGFRRTFGYDVILKGFNVDEVAERLHDNWSQFRRPCAIGLDATRFDQHVSEAALCYEHSVYNSVFRSPELKRLLRWQLKNRGIARVGNARVDYQVDGCRMSGDINTGMGNCLIMSSIVLAYCQYVGVNARLANNGDDCVLFFEASDLPKFAAIDEWFQDFGFTLTREEPVYRLEQVEFCQFQPVQLYPGFWRMVRNPFVAMSKDCVSLSSWEHPGDFTNWCAAVGKCGLALTTGVPVWHAWYDRLVRIGSGSTGVDERVQESGAWHWGRGTAVLGEISWVARVSFYHAFQVLPDMQLALEAEYSDVVEILPTTPVMHPAHNISIDQENNPLRYG